MRQISEQSAQKGSHFAMKFFNSMVRDKLIRIFDHLFADYFLTLFHFIDHDFVLVFIFMAIILIAFLVFIGWVDGLFIQILEEIVKGFRDLDLHLFIFQQISIFVLEFLAKFLEVQGFLEELIGIFFLHVPTRHFQFELLEVEKVRDAGGELSEYSHKVLIGGILAAHKFPISHLNTNFLAGYVASQSLVDIKHRYEFFLTAIPHVSRMKPKRFQFLFLAERKDCVTNSQKGSIADVEAIEDYFQSGQLSTGSNGAFQIINEVSKHRFFVVWEIAISTAFEGKLSEGRILDGQLQSRQFLYEIMVIFGGKELTRTLMNFMGLAVHTSDMY